MRRVAPYGLLLSALSCGGGELAPAGDGGFDAAHATEAGNRPDTGTEGVADAYAEGDAVPDGAACGEPGQQCCSGNACLGEGCCVESYCTANGQMCPSALGLCTGGSCASCGGVAQPCCPMTSAGGQYQVCSRDTTPDCSGCTASGAVCPNNKPTDTCIACGGDNQPCCSFRQCLPTLSVCVASDVLDASAADANATVTSYLCTTHCGHEREPCCQGEVCLDGGCCVGGPSGSLCAVAPTCGCTNGVCTTCGRQECCPGGLCQKVSPDTYCEGTSPGLCTVPL